MPAKTGTIARRERTSKCADHGLHIMISFLSEVEHLSIPRRWRVWPAMVLYEPAAPGLSICRPPDIDDSAGDEVESTVVAGADQMAAARAELAGIETVHLVAVDDVGGCPRANLDDIPAARGQCVGMNGKCGQPQGLSACPGEKRDPARGT